MALFAVPVNTVEFTVLFTVELPILIAVVFAVTLLPAAPTSIVVEKTGAEVFATDAAARVPI